VAAVALGACAGQKSSTPDLGPEVVNAAPETATPSGVVAARFWAELEPRTGTWTFYRLHPGNVIYRNQPITSAVQFDFQTATEASSCTPGVDCPADTIHMFTDQNRVTFVDGTTCYNNGNVVDLTADPTCGGALDPASVCAQDQVFCGPVQITSNYTVRLADPVLDIANAGGTPDSPVDGCVGSATDSSTGLCYQTSEDKVSPALGGVDPAIPGDPGNGLYPCSFCYGNATAADNADVPGLADVLTPGVNSAVQAINTNMVALRLDNGGASLDVTLTLYFSLPTFDPPTAQLTLFDITTGTPLSCLDRSQASGFVLAGGAFGPPGACLTGGLPQTCSSGGCCGTGAPGAGHTVSFVGPVGAAATLSPEVWSDTQIADGVAAGGMPESSIYGCGVTVNTPAGSITTDDEISICGDQWRAGWSALISRYNAAGGLLGGQMVIVGGRQSLSSLAASSSGQVLALPSCANATPTPTALSANLPLARWGAASTVGSGGLYVIGGTSNGSAFTTCANTVYRLPAVGSAWQTLANLPAPLCGATALTLSDGGQERIVVLGGVNRPVPNTGFSVSPVLSTAIYVYNPATNTWTTAGQTMAAARVRFNAGGASNGTVGIMVGGYRSVTSFTQAAVALVDRVSISGGVVTVTAGTNLPANASLPGVTQVNGTVYVSGGAPTGVAVGASNFNPPAGSNRLFSAPLAADAAWTTLASSGDSRAGGLFYVAQFNEAVFTDLTRLVTIGGAHRTAASTFTVNANEYQP
jgi:hypothetical protein